MTEKLYNCSEIAFILNRDRANIRYFLNKLEIAHVLKKGRVRYFDDEAIRQLILPCGVFYDPDEVALEFLPIAESVTRQFYQQYISLLELARIVGYEPHALQVVFRRDNGPKSHLFHNRIHYLKADVLNWICVEKPALVNCITNHFALTD